MEATCLLPLLTTRRQSATTRVSETPPLHPRSLVRLTTTAVSGFLVSLAPVPDHPSGDFPQIAAHVCMPCRSVLAVVERDARRRLNEAAT